MAHLFHKPKNIYRKTEPFPEDTPQVKGYDFNQGVDHKALLQSYFNTGFQATHFGLAVREINRMVRWVVRPDEFVQNFKGCLKTLFSHPQIESRQQPWKDVNNSKEKHPPNCPCLSNCTIFLGYTSNLISSGVRESIRYLAEHKMVWPIYYYK